MKKNFSLPIKYEQQQFDDDRFLKLKIYVMHEGVNLNESNFDMDSIERAKDSIKNVPILAFVKENDGDDSKDFAGHEMELIFKDDTYKFKYLGRPIGVIPADEHNYHYEIIDDKHYVVVDGYVWKDYANDALDILQIDEVKGQSMEITIDSYSFTEDGIMNIVDYKYTGICLLGDDVTPAMVGAKAEVITPQVFNKSKFKETISNMLAELNESLKFELEGGHDMDKKKETKEVKDDKLEKNPNENQDEFEDKIDKKDETDEKQSEDKMSKDKTNDDNDGDEDGVDNDNDGDGTVDYQVKYEQLKAEYDTLLAELADYKEKFSSFEEELESLRKFKAETLTAKRQEEENELFEKFSNELTEDDMKPIKEKASEYSLDELEEKLFALAGRKKVKFSHTQKKERISMGLFDIDGEPQIEKDVWAEQKEKFSSNK